MKKNTVVILIMSTFLMTALIVGGVIFFVFGGDLTGDKPDQQRILIEKGYFNTKTEKNGSIHIVTTGCKVYYKERYKKKVDKVITGCTEDINAIIGEYFREKTIEDVTESGYFEKTEVYIKDELNKLLNEKIKSKESLPIDYVTDVVLFNTVYQ